MRRTCFLPTFLSLACLVLWSTTTLAQTTIHVPVDKSTIQAAIDASQNGDTVLVDPGTYNERIDFHGKNITLTSSGGAAQTIIDGQQGGSVVSFHNSETNAAVLSGFTIQNGKADYGAGVDIESAAPIVEHNIITANNCGTGAGVYVDFSSAIVRYNVIHHNNRAASCYPSGIGGGGITIGGSGQAKVLYNLIYENQGGYEGGGIGMWAAGQALVEGNIIRNNYSTGSTGGGMSIQNEGSSIVRNNVIVNNYGGGVDWGRMPGDFSNNTVAGNSSLPNTVELAALSWWDGTFRNNLIVASTGATAIHCDSSTTYGITAANFTYNDVYSDGGSAYSCPAQTGTNNNISIDPKFANPAAGNYHLSTGSPVIDIANGAITLPATDADLNPRVVAGAGGTALLDMGAYEYQGTTTMTVSSTALSFADQKTNTSSPAQTVTITNTGAVALHLKHIDIGADFQQTSDCETPDGIAAGKTCTINVVFLPLTGSSKAETMTLAGANVAAAPTTVNLAGKATAPVASLSTTSLTFSDQMLYTTSAAQAVTLTNTGDADLVVSSINVTGDFAQTNNCGTLAPNASCTISVTFTPTVTHTRTGAVMIADDAAGTPHGFSLTGNGIGPEISFSPTAVAFTPQSVNTISNAETITVSNTGGYNLVISAVQATGDYVIQSNNCIATLVPTASCQVAVQFLPTLIGTRLGTVSFTDNASASPQTVSMSGQGTAPILQERLVAAFPNAIYGATTSQTFVSLRNIGSEPLVISSITMTGTSFSQTNNCTAPLAINGGCTVSLTFTPSSVGTQTGALQVSSNALGSPSTLSLSATAISAYPVPTIAGISPSALQIGAGDTTLSVAGTNFYPATTILFDGQPITTTFVSAQQLTASITAAMAADYGEHTVAVSNPTPGGGTSPTVAMVIYRAVPVSARDMVFDRYRQVFYATVSAGSATNTNSVVSIEPTTGTVTKLVDLGAEGRRLAISDDGQYLYVGIDSANAIKRVNLYSGRIDLTIALGTSGFLGPYVAGDILPLPGAPRSIAVALWVTTTTTPPDRVAIFDDGVERPTTYAGGYPGSLTFVSDPATLYVASASVSPSTLTVLNVTATGVTYSNSKFDARTANINSDGQSIFSYSIALSPVTLNQIGGFSFIGASPTYVSSNFPERGTYRNFMASKISSSIPAQVAIWSGNSQTFSTSNPVIVPVPLASGSFADPSSLSRWGSSGLAFRMYGGSTNLGGFYSSDEIVLIRSGITNPSAGPNAVPVISSLTPASAVVGTQNTSIIVTGTGFVPGAYVAWNGDERSTEFIDSTRVKVFLPSSDFAASGTAKVTAVNPGTGGGTSNEATFSIIPTGPVVQFATTPLAFGNQLINTTSAAQSVALSNPGTDPLVISSIAVTGGFAQTNNCGSSLAAGASCTITVTFVPKATGAASGALTITHNAAGSPGTVTLSGKGTDFTLSNGSGGSAPSQTVTAGQAATFNLSIAGSDGFAGSAALTCSGVPTLATCAVNPSSVTLNGTTPAPFTVTLATSGRSGGFQSSAGPRDPRIMYLFGFGLMAALLLAMNRRQPRLRSAAALASILIAVALVGCGGGGGGPTSTGTTTSTPGTPAGTYTVVVTATSGTATRTMNLTVTVN